MRCRRTLTTQGKLTRWVLGTCGVAALAYCGLALAADKPADKSDPAVERTREQVRMLDDLYKTAVVLITQHYVEADSDLPAGTAAKALFAAMQEKGWHTVRLVDATGQPIQEENSPADSFEKEAIKQLKAGQAYYDQVVEIDGRPHLRAATIIPVVLEKCTMCHEHYKQVKEGEAIGALCYTLKIQ